MTDPKYKRLDPEHRKQQILEAAIALAKEEGYYSLGLRNVARSAKCSPGLVLNYFGSVLELQSSVMKEAIKKEIIEIIVQGVVNKNIDALNAPSALISRSLSHISH